MAKLHHAGTAHGSDKGHGEHQVLVREQYQQRRGRNLNQRRPCYTGGVSLSQDFSSRLTFGREAYGVTADTNRPRQRPVAALTERHVRSRMALSVR